MCLFAPRESKQHRKPSLLSKNLEALAWTYLHPWIRMLHLRPIRTVQSNLSIQITLTICKGYQIHYSTPLRPCRTSLKEGRPEHARQSRGIHYLLLSIRQVSLIWRCCSAYAAMQDQMMNSCSNPGSSPLVSSTLRPYSLSQC